MSDAITTYLPMDRTHMRCGNLTIARFAHSFFFAVLLCAPLVHGSLFDSFDDDVTDPNLWTVDVRGVGPTIAERNGQVEMFFPAWSNNGADIGFSASYISKEIFTGDFDLQVDFDCSDWPAGNGVRLGLSIAPWFVTARVSNVYGLDRQEAYVLGHYGGLTVLGTSDLSGSLRMVRKGAVLTGYYWDQQRGWTVIGSGTGPSGYVYFAFSAWSSDAHFGGKPVSVAFDNFEGRVVATTQVPPAIEIKKPVADSSFPFRNGGTPIDIEFEALDKSKPITGLAAAVNGEAVAIQKSGLGSLKAKGTARYVCGGIGKYVVTASGTSAGGTGVAAAEFGVDYDLRWLPPISLDKFAKGGSTVPIKFSIRDVAGKFIHDKSVVVIVSEIFSAGEERKSVAVFGKGSSCVRIDDVGKQYVLNFKTAKGAHKYRVDAFFAGVAYNDFEFILQGSKELSVR
jgi:hypothetical protein